ncbi:hypothetical protein H0Z09_00905 [Pseudomonas sp. SWRI18]|uniref:hypothetical protein n=1 Tax=Pseudomonas sp. SWRI18 TaxID=2753888 RepID=UPI001647534B|nr:hypothetical protein [Pseudomonas sp. SWRI18]MBC3299669.1 hypothetical protein [Pseudomonas sp. SWRI18]
MPSSTSQHSPQVSLTSALITQMASGPAFREVAARLLREELLERYPHLDIDPNIAMVGTPVWEIVEDQVVSRPANFQALTDILAVQAVLAVPALYIEGEHFLTQLPITDPPLHLPVSILDIAGMLNTLAPVMLRGYQQSQLDFWNQLDGDSGPRWQALSSVLRDYWNVQDVEGWTQEDCRMARQLYQAPDPLDRRANDPYDTRAYLVDIDQVDADGRAEHLNDRLVSVLIGKQDGREVILVYSLLLGHRKYASLEQLGNDVSLLVYTATPHETIQWRLLEPEGDFFDQLACTMISIQIVAIGSMDFSDLRESGNPIALAMPPTPKAQDNGHDLQWYQDALPDWLSDAAPADLDAYARHLKDLAALHGQNHHNGYQDGIEPIKQFALECLRAEMLKDHPEAEPGTLEGLEIEIQSPVVWGAFAVPGQIETTVFSLTELALQNLIALPLGIESLRKKTTQALPDWLTVGYLKSLITRVDIGTTYPALIKQTLLDDPQESARRQQLYTQHLRIQLPLLALQHKIRHEAGIDERGYRFVKAALEVEPADRQVDGHAIVIRRLAFVPTRRLDSTPDVVDNMFVIGPQAMNAGPCLLYRPLLDQPLTQYPSPANLLYAIQQSSSLRDSVLAWLPDSTRDDYERYVFPGTLPSPWVAVDFLVDPLKLLTWSGPLALGTATLEDGGLASLYKANADALVKLADRQSVSNAEARWATFKRAGWLIFNAALPFLGRMAGVAAWIWQIMDDLQQLAEAEQHPDRPSPQAALADLLLNLGMAIALHSAARSAPRRQVGAEPARKPAPRPPAAVKPVLRKVADITSATLPSDHAQPLHSLGATSSTPVRLSMVLDRFKIDKPAELGEAIATEGAHQHLYRSGEHYYAPVGERWFQVQVDENEAVMIVDATRPERTGPLLIHNREGQWFIDTRLRLRGGGPKFLAKKARELAQKRAQELRKELSEFESGKKTAQQQLQQAQQAIAAGPSTSAQAAYSQALREQCADYEQALQKLKSLSVHAPTPDYPKKSLAYLKAQTELTQAAIKQTLIEFTPLLRAGLEQIELQAQAPRQRDIENARQLNTLNKEMIKHLSYMQTRFDELRKLGNDGARLIRTLQGALPGYSSEDLKALQVVVARNLCLPESTLATQPEAWTAMDQIVTTGEIAIQCLRDTLRDQRESHLDERIDTLSSLVEQFQLLDERLQDFPAEFSEQAIDTQLQELRDHLKAFRHRATAELGLLSAERDIFRKRPTPPPTPPSPARKFIKTRYHGQLIGEPRLADLATQTWLVEIRSPLTHQVVATFHEKPNGIWVERVRTPTPSTTPVDLQARIADGQALLDQLPAFLERASNRAELPERTPFGIELLYHQHASRLERAVAAIENALTQSNVSDTPAASEVRTALSQAVSDLYVRANQHVLTALKQHPPTVAGVEWLKNHDAITIKKTINRRRLKSPTPDYLDEYALSDGQTQEVLWYAHFHYSTDWTPPKAYLSARLKTPAERSLGAAADTPKGLTNEQRIAFYRSEISLRQAQALFFEKSKTRSGN